MTFKTFLSKCQQMFNIYFKERKPMEEDAKIRFLFKKINNQDGPGSVSHTSAANHLSTAVSKLP
eukprot:1576290-Ditylum_brightwellii.AAC.1